MRNKVRETQRKVLTGAFHHTVQFHHKVPFQLTGAIQVPAANYSIRPAAFSDWPVIAEYNARLASETEGRKLDPETLEAGVKALLSDPGKGRYFVAVDAQGAVIGQLMHTREWSDWRNGDIWWLQSVYVHPDHRGNGVFKGLFQHLKSAAEADPGVVGLRLYVEEHNTVAQDVYRQLGMSKAGYLVCESFHRNAL